MISVTEKMKSDLNDNLAQATELLAGVGQPVPSDFLGQVEHYVQLIREWSPRISLVSHGDGDKLYGAHIVDSLSLVPYVKAITASDGYHLDIGSGAGFPGLPLAMALPDRQFILSERGERKSFFLELAIRGTGLGNVSVLRGAFPECCRGLGFVPTSLSCRAIERPEKVIKDIVAWLPAGSTFLCQSKAMLKGIPGMFHVEQIDDAWTRQGLRRGGLWLVRRSEESQ